MIFVFGTLVGCLAGCNDDGAGAGTTVSHTAEESDGDDTPKVVTLNGTPLEEYTVVYAQTDTKFESKTAEKVRSVLQEAFGIRLKVRSDTSADVTQKAIVVGSLKNGAISDQTETIEEGEWSLTADTDRVYLLSKTEYGYLEALNALTIAVQDAVESKTMVVSKNTKQNYEEKRMTTMTFNIRNWDKSAGHLYRIKQTVKAYTPDMIGFQEISNKAGYEWVDKLLADSEIDDMYGYVGKDRMDSTGEQCAIFYRKDKFTVVDSGTRWLYCTHGIKCTSTDCKGETTPGRFEGTKYSSSEHFRIMTYARLKRISDGKELTFINTHLETWDGMLDGERRQTKQVDYILNFAKELTDKGETVVITGDFNSYLDSPACKKTLQAGFKCAEVQSHSFVGEEIKNGEKYLSENLPMCSKIDHIFISSPKCYFETYTYCNHKIKYEGVEDYPSDHIPRIATYTLG